MLLIILILALLIVAYFMIVDIETKEPNEISYAYNLRLENYIGRKVFIVTPKNRDKTDKVILYFHGGAYMAEATKQHWEFIEKLIDDTGATVIFPDYPLTPKYNYKDVFNMVVPLYKEIEQKIDVEKNLIIMGDSAGGGLGLALLEKVSEESLKMPQKTILISPWLDVRLDNPEIEQIQVRDKKLNKEALKLSGIAYAGEDGIDNYLVNPIDGDLSKIKDITILIGKDDILNPDAHKLKEKAEEINVSINLKEYENASHIWLIDKDSDKEIVKKGYEDLISIINNNS